MLDTIHATIEKDSATLSSTFGVSKALGDCVASANAAARLGEFPQVEAALYDNQASWDADGNMEKFIAAAMPAATFNKVKALAMSCDYPAPTSKFMASISRAPHEAGLVTTSPDQRPRPLSMASL